MPYDDPYLNYVNHAGPQVNNIEERSKHHLWCSSRPNEEVGSKGCSCKKCEAFEAKLNEKSSKDNDITKDICYDCNREMAKNLKDVINGLCPKYWAYRDPDAYEDCKNAKKNL